MYKPFTEEDFKQMYSTFIGTDVDDVSFGTPEWSYERYLQEQFIKRLKTSDAQKIRLKATEIALKHFFCDIDTDERLQGVVEFYENGFDVVECTTVEYAVWYPFERYDADELYAEVTNLMVSIIETFNHDNENEPNDNNGGYMVGL